MKQSHRNEKGFALPLTLLLLTMLTVMLTSAFARMGTEIETASATEMGVEALAVAQSGLEKYFGTDVTYRPRSGDSVRYNVTGGYAWIVPEPLYTPTDTTDDYTFIVRSTGYVIHPAQGSTPLSSRTVAQFAVWQTGAIPEYAALTAANGARRRSGGEVKIYGQDLICGTGETVLHTRRTGSASYILDASSGGMSSSGTASDLASSFNMAWDVINSGEFEADYTSFQAWDATYPTIVIDGDFELTDTGGYGTLVVTGDFRTKGDFAYWQGLVLVGEDIHFDAVSSWFYGAVVSGLDEQLGQSQSTTDIGGSNRNTYIYYAPCIVDMALLSLTGFRPIDNTLVDNWAEWGN